MDTREIFRQAFSQLDGEYSCPDHETAFNDVLERAKNMKKDITLADSSHPGLIEITPEYTKPKKSTKILHAVAGVAGAAAVLTGAVFGLKFFAENGGLKERGSDEIRAGYSETEALYTMPVKEGEEFVAPTSNTIDPDTLPDISEAYGKAVQFHDATAWLNGTEYDGEIFTARFSILYTGDDYENYSPEYVKLTVGTRIDYNNEQFSIEKVPEADGFTHRCTYSVPVKLEPLKAYAMGIEYLNTDGKATQPIEADRQQYKFVYSGDGVVYEFEKCSVMPVSYTFDGMTLDMNCYVRFKDSSVKDEPDLGLFFTSPYNASVIDSDREINGDGAYLHIRVMYMALADKCSITIGDNVVDNTFAVRSEMKEYTFTAERADGEKILQAEIDPPEGNDDEIYPGFVSAAPSAVCVAYYGTGSDTFVQPEKLMIVFDNGKTIEGEYLSQVFTYKASISDIRYNIPVCDPQLIRKIYLGDRCIYESPAEDTDSSVIDQDLTQIEGIYPAGYEFPYEIVYPAETEEGENATILPEFPKAISNGNGLYGEYLETPLTGDEAWELVKERGGIDTDYPFPYDKSIFKFTGTEFCIEYADFDVTALAGGTVEFAGFYKGWGNTVIILDENGHYWLYGHLAKGLNVAQGDTVEAGAVLGHTGSTGFIDHQHYAMRVG